MWKTFIDKDSGFSFQYPSSWSAEVLPDMAGILLVCPEIEAGWQTNAHFELGKDRDSRTMKKRMEDLIPNIRSRKVGFQLKSSGITTHSSGLTMGRFDFTHVFEGTKLSDSEILIEFEKDIILFVMISTGLKVEGKYQPTLEKVVDSIRKI